MGSDSMAVGVRTTGWDGSEEADCLYCIAVASLAM